MDRGIETALLHGHPLVVEELQHLADLQAAFPGWEITRADAGGWRALHRTDSYDVRTARVGVVPELHRATLGELGDGLLAQQALRGEGVGG